MTQLTLSLEALMEPYHHLQAIPQELDASMENFLARAMGRIGDGLRGTYQNLRDLSPLKLMLSDERRFLSVIEKNDYMGIAALNVNVPEGLQVDYLTFAELTHEVARHCASLNTEVLEPIRKVLAEIVSQPQAKYDMKRELVKAFNEREAHRKQIHQALLACFNDSHVKIVPYERAIQRNADWKAVTARCVQIEREVTLDKAQLQKDVAEILSLVEALVELIETDSSFTKLNPKLKTQMADLVRQAAEEVSFLNVSFYFSQMLFTNISFTMKELIKKLR